MQELQDTSHKRFNPLIGEWVLVSPHRAKRPWQGQEESNAQEIRSSYDEDCYLCPGNYRANGVQNPDYKDVFVFQNDFAALLSPKQFEFNKGLIQASSESGICKVVCFSPDHSKSLAEMTPEAITKVVTTWQDEFNALSEESSINHIQIFENKGAVMGCSNPHPHGQIWAQSSIPNEVVKKGRQQLQYFNTNQKTLLSDYTQQELDLNERIIFENTHFVILVPFWAIWPFETMIIPKKEQAHIGQMSFSECQSYAEAISVITQLYDLLFNCSFPYSSGIHQAPCNDSDSTHWHWHMSFYPPLLRSATVKKFMVGYEMFGMPQRDITAEKATFMLRALLPKLNIQP